VNVWNFKVQPLKDMVYFDFKVTLGRRIDSRGHSRMGKSQRGFAYAIIAIIASA
jgi:hypothetical protein